MACAVLDVPVPCATSFLRGPSTFVSSANARTPPEPVGREAEMFPRNADAAAFLSETSETSDAVRASLAGSGMARCRLEAVRARRRATPGGTLLGPRSSSSPDAARVTSAPPRGSDRPRDPSRPFAFADRPARISCRREDDDAARLAPPRDVSRASFKEQTHTCEVDAVSWRPRAVLGKAETPAETPEVAHIFPRHPGRQKSYGLVSDSAAGAAGLESRRPRLERTTARAGSRLLAPIVQLGKPTLGLGLRPRPRV